MDSAQLAARLEDLTEHYDRAVDEVEAEIVELKRQISIASRLVESTPSFEYLPPRSPSPPLSFGSSQGAHVELVGRLEELTDRYNHTVEKAGAEVCRLQRPEPRLGVSVEAPTIATRPALSHSTTLLSSAPPHNT